MWLPYWTVQFRNLAHYKERTTPCFQVEKWFDDNGLLRTIKLKNCTETPGHDHSRFKPFYTLSCPPSPKFTLHTASRVSFLTLTPRHHVHPPVKALHWLKPSSCPNMDVTVCVRDARVWFPVPSSSTCSLPSLPHASTPSPIRALEHACSSF